MPGLSQLKKFNSDILSVGNETELRSQRGEKPVIVPIPKTIKDIDDSGDFITGMPEISPKIAAKKTEKKIEEDDFSDIMGISKPVQSSVGKEQKTDDSPGIDVSSLFSIVNNPVANTSQDSMPDLSMFAEPVGEVEPEIKEEKPKEKEISELSLEDLLGGAGFDGSEGTAEEQETEAQDDIESAEDAPVEEKVENDIELAAMQTVGDALPLDQLMGIAPEQNNFIPGDADFSSIDNFYTYADNASPTIENIKSEEVKTEDAEPITPVDDVISSEELPAIEGFEDFDELPPMDVGTEPLSDEFFSGGTLDSADLDNSAKDVADGLDELSSSVPEGLFDTADIEMPELGGSSDDTSEFSDTNFDMENLPDLESDLVSDNAGNFSLAEDLSKIETEDINIDGTSHIDDLSSTLPADFSEDFPEDLSLPDDLSSSGIEDLSSDNFENDVLQEDNTDSSLDSLDGLSLPEDLDEKNDNEELPQTDLSGLGADFSIEEELPLPDDLSSSDMIDLSLPESDMDESLSDLPETDTFAYNLPSENETDLSSENLPEDLSLPDDLSMPEDLSLPEENSGETFSAEDFDVSLPSEDALDSGTTSDPDISSDAADSLSDIPQTSDKDASGGFEDIDFDTDFDKKDDSDILSSIDFDFSDAGDEVSGEIPGGESLPAEDFDVSQMEGMEFPETDARIAGGKSEFELGDADDFAMDNGDFEIAGFTDVETADLSRKNKEPLSEPDFGGAAESNNLPPNTLSDENYEKFIKNLSKYPLNVRLAVEEVIVKNEFTDEAEFEIVEKILKKVSARQLASELEKMLDISIPVPRDFERRTAEEYEAYKASFQYQLRNRIIPGAIFSMAAMSVIVLLFLFAKYFIYRPARASHLYRQGYALIQAEEYPQSEIKFLEATKFNLQKKWFYRYAQAYREHKQYIRAEQMYKNILAVFNYDKSAGLLYADMEMNELANYEKAETILKRSVLDHHVNDADGILLLGDNYLEWATEKDESKFEEAKNCYSQLLQLYKDKNLVFTSRMLRYFIRTDNLLKVLELKETFMPSQKLLGSSDWTELSGYLLDKLYGTLPPSYEYLRSKIEDVKELLMRAVKTDASNPVALYNLGRYYVQMNNAKNIESTLNQAITAFEKSPSVKKRDVYKNIDSYRLLGEMFVYQKEFLKALEAYTGGISLFHFHKENSGLAGNSLVGKLYADIGDIDYFVSGNLDSALQNYQDSVDNENDNSEIRYKIGYIQYGKKNYPSALGSFMKAMEESPDDKNLLLAMGNTLSLRNDNFAAEGYYERLLELIGAERKQKGILFPQTRKDQYEIVDSYLKTTNNYGVTLYRLARRTGNSSKNAQAMVQFQESMRAWDSLTRNQQTMIRLGGSNLAEQNMKYISHPVADYEPAIYTDLERTLHSEEGAF